MNPSKSCAVLILSVLLSGCFYKYTVKDHVNVCWDKNRRNFVREIDNKNIEFIFSPEITNQDEAIDDKVFWVRITAFNKGRKYFFNDRDLRKKWQPGNDAIPMFYSTEHAYVESDDGIAIKAAPGIYFADQRDYSKPGRWIATGTVDINSDEIQLSNKSGNSMYGSIYIKFDTKPPRPDAQWRLHLGSVKISGEPVELKPFELCSRKGSSTWTWSSFRP